MTIRPYCESVVIGSDGDTYDPDITIQYHLTDDDFIDKEDEDPVQVMRSISADAYNCVKVEFVNSENEYNTDISEAKDTADIELNGIREADTISLHYIHDRSTATSIAYMLLRKNLYVRNRCKFALPIKYCLLEVFDVVTITDMALGYDRRPFRIIEITENEDGTSEYEGEECFLGVDYSHVTVENPNGNIYEDTTSVGNVNPPIIFTAPMALSNGSLELWLAISGKEKDWGGCQIWTSWDDASYSYLLNKQGPSVTGRLVKAVSETAAQIVIDVSESRMPLNSVSHIDAQNMASVCYLDGEFFTYETAELIGKDQYKLKTLERGLFGIAKSSHEQGVGFAKIDSTIKKMQITQSLMGQTVNIKFVSFDTMGDHIQYLDTVKTYTHYIASPDMPQVTSINLTVSAMTNVIVDFTVRQSSEYMFSEVYYQVEAAETFIYGGMDRQRVIVNGLETSQTYLFKVVPVVTGGLKGNIDSAKGQTIIL